MKQETRWFNQPTTAELNQTIARLQGMVVMFAVVCLMGWAAFAVVVFFK